MFGIVPAESFTVDSDQEITATVPAESAGTVDVTVATPAGTSGTSGLDEYAFGPPPSFGYASAAISPDSRTAYLTVPFKDEVEVLDLQTGAYEAPIRVGSWPEGIDITPNGTTLYVCDSGGQVISVVDLATGDVKTIVTPASPDMATPWQIVIGDNGTAVFTTAPSGTGLIPAAATWPQVPSLSHQALGLTAGRLTMRGSHGARTTRQLRLSLGAVRPARSRFTISAQGRRPTPRSAGCSRP